MKLVDADRLSENIYDNVPAPYEDSREAKEECLRAIEDAPTIDAVPVVRCKDCDHYALWKDGRAMFHCDKRDCTMYDDDFCSYGKRKDGAGGNRR